MARDSCSSVDDALSCFINELSFCHRIFNSKLRRDWRFVIQFYQAPLLDDAKQQGTHTGSSTRIAISCINDDAHFSSGIIISALAVFCFPDHRHGNDLYTLSLEGA